MQMVTKENFQEYEEMVCRMERQRSIRAAERNKGVTAATIAYCMTAPFILTFMSYMIAPNESSNEDVLTVFLLSALIEIVIFLIFHFVTALVIKMTYAGVSSVPLNGSDFENAKKLCERCKAIGDRLDVDVPYYLYKGIISCICAGLFVVCTLVSEGFKPGWGIGDLIVGALAAALLFSIAWGIFFFIYSFLLGLTGLFYCPDGNSELQKLLDCYADSCEEQERKRIQAEDARRRAERAKEERRRMEEAEQNRKRGDEIYRQAVATDEVDEHLMQQAADLGSRPACLYLGRQMYEAFASDAYTKAEKKRIAEKAIRYFRTASLEEDSAEARTEAKFGYLSFQCMTESGDYDKWSDMLSQLREIQKSGNLPERYQEPFATLISLVVEMVDQTAPRTSRQNAKSHRNDEEPVVKRCYCKFSNAGICSKKSGSYYTAHCDHASNPGQCSIALGNGGLGFEFE